MSVCKEKKKSQKAFEFFFSSDFGSLLNVLKTKTLAFDGKDDFNKVAADAEEDCGSNKIMSRCY